MNRYINIYFIEYALSALLRQKGKNFFIFIVFTLLVFLLTTIFSITSSIKYQLETTVESLPEIIVQNKKAGRHYDIDVNYVDEILEISGVSDAVARVWGYYYFEYGDVYFSLVGVDQFEAQYKNSLESIVSTLDLNEPQVYVGQGVKKIMEQNYYKEYFNFIKTDGSIKKVRIAGVFESDLELESNDMIIGSKELVRELFEIDERVATDIVVKVSNKDEIDTVALKIKELLPTAKVVTKDDLKVSYTKLFNYKSGVFLALFLITIFTFFIIIYDKSSGLTSEEKREIGILKAIGWRVEDLLKEKFYESFIISFLAYILGVLFALIFVYILQAPLIKEIFIGVSGLKPSFNLPFVLDFQVLMLVLFLSVPIYIASIIIPAWRVATLESDEVMR